MCSSETWVSQQYLLHCPLIYLVTQHICYHLLRIFQMPKIPLQMRDSETSSHAHTPLTLLPNHAYRHTHTHTFIHSFTHFHYHLHSFIHFLTHSHSTLTNTHTHSLRLACVQSLRRKAIRHAEPCCWILTHCLETCVACTRTSGTLENSSYRGAWTLHS